MKLPRRSISAAGGRRRRTAGVVACRRGRKPIRRGRCASSSVSRAGGATDILARLIGQWLSERLGQPFMVENRPGAGSNIATEAVVRAPPTATRCCWSAPPNAINATLYDKLSFNFIRDIAPVAGIDPRAQRDGGEPGASGQDGSGIHRLRQGQSGQGQHGVGRHRHADRMSPASCSR